MVRAWRRKLQHEFEEFRGKIGRLHHVADVEIDRAIAALDRILRALDGYIERSTPSAAANTDPSVSDVDDAGPHRSVESSS